MFALAADTDPQAALDAARARWRDGGIANYRFHVQRSCFCPSVYTRRYRVDVVGGEAYDAPKWIDRIDTVPKLFARIQEGIDGEGTIDVTYAESGLPTSIAADPIPMAVDDEYGVRADGLEETSGAKPRAVDDTIEDGTAAEQLQAARALWTESGYTRYRYRLDGRAVRVVDGAEPRLFKTAARAIRRRATRLEVRYGKTGFPRRVRVDSTTRTATRLRRL